MLNFPCLPALVTISALALLAGCSAPVLTNTDKLSRDNFSVGGRFTVNYEKADGTPDSVSGSFDWLQQGEKARIDLRSPFGQTLAQIVVDDTAQLIVPDQPAVVAPDVETLTQEQLGWRLPAKGLRDWLIGQNGGARPERLTQNGWQIDYLAWNGPLPRRINVTWLTAKPKLELRLVLDRWE